MISRDVVRLTESVEAWNVDGSSDARPRGGSWLQTAETETGRRRGRCSFAGCCNGAQVGGHVWIRGEGCFVAPICRSCNRCDNPSRMQGAGARLRGHIDVVRAEVTWGMRNAPRRLAVEERGRGSGRRTPSQSRPRLADAEAELRALGAAKGVSEGVVERLLGSLDRGRHRA